MNRLLTICILSLLMIASPIFAQVNEETNGSKLEQQYTTALRYFNNGQFEKADKELKHIASITDGLLRSGALRLLALSALERGDDNLASTYVSTLLKCDPYFSPNLGDPQRFIDMIEHEKYRGTTITTASQQAETIEEAPVPVIVISEKMIQNIGARTLKDALVTYVPGMTDISSNEEMNVAMRGIYSSGQEKILILLNGHRLNSYSTNVATPDFSMSLEKVKQIEVLRGPASSIYGGVALTGVVNIITKQGAEINGVDVKLSIGNYGQKRANILFGKQYMGLDISAWANVYNATGEKVHYDESEQPYSVAPHTGDIIIGGYNKLPSFDIGTNITYNSFSILYNRRFSKTVAPYTLSSFFAPYSYDKYKTWNGNSPGYAITSDHARFTYQDSHKDLSWLAALTYDHQEQQRYQIGGDELPEYLADYIDIFFHYMDDTIRIPFRHGGFQSVNWSERTIGGQLQASYKYRLNNKQDGYLLLGAQFNHFKLYDASYMEGVDFDKVMKTFYEEKILKQGEENYADAYMQVKHHFGKTFILNAGLRYDYKKRRSGKRLNEISPRIAFILCRPYYSLKLSYSRAFVDAPYFYRSNTLDINYGDENLNPEHLDSYQLSILSNRKLIKNLYFDAILFYNRASNFIVSFYEISNINAGEVTSHGVELTTRYFMNKLTIGGNLTWQRIISSEDFNKIGDYFLNVPQISGNISMNYAFNDNFSLHGNTNMLSNQYGIFLKAQQMEEIKIPSRMTFNIGVSYQWNKLHFNANIYNLTNKKYEQGGSSFAPIRQQGRWCMFDVAYSF